MKKKHLYVIYILIIYLPITYCTNNEDSYTKTFSLNDSTILYIKYRNDTIIDSFAKQNARIEGLRKLKLDDSFYRYVQYHDGKINGQIVEISLDNKEIFRGYIRDDSIQIEDWYNFYPNGNIAVFQYFDNNGKRVFYTEYDTSGKRQKTTGNPIVSVKGKKERGMLGETLTLTWNVVKPPEGKVYYYVATQDNDSTTTKDLTLIKPLTDVYGVYSEERILSKKGWNYVALKYVWKDNFDNIIHEGHSYFKCFAE